MVLPSLGRNNRNEVTPGMCQSAGAGAWKGREFLQPCSGDLGQRDTRLRRTGETLPGALVGQQDTRRERVNPTPLP